MLENEQCPTMWYSQLQALGKTAGGTEKQNHIHDRSTSLYLQGVKK